MATHAQRSNQGSSSGSPITMHRPSLAWFPRVGYIAKGLVYMLVGGLAVMTAIGWGGQSGGSKSALQALMGEPFGLVMVGALALGLACYSAWRWMQAIADPEDKTDKDHGWITRTVYFASAITHSALTIYAVMLIIGAASSSSDDSGGMKQQITATVMGFPGGRVLVGAFGLAVVAAGIGELAKAAKQSFMKKLDLGSTAQGFRTFIKGFGSFGLAARGVVFAIIGGLFVYAAWTFDSDKAAGVGDAMRTLREQPFGAYLFGAIALGLVCYGAFQIIKGIYRRINVA